MWTPLLLLACSGGSQSPADIASLPITDTFPAFHGSVPKNLLIISMDTLRRDKMARYGNTSGITPFLDELASEGVALDHHQSCSNWTLPGVLCAESGRSPLDWGFVPLLVDEYEVPERPHLATWLNDAGYTTILEASNGWVLNNGASYGYDFAERPDGSAAKYIYANGKNALEGYLAAGTDHWMVHLHVKEPHVAYDPPDEYLAGLDDLEPIHWDLTQFSDHYSAVHTLQTTSEDDRDLILQHMLVRYEGEIRYLDDQLRDAFTDLDEAGLLDDTLVVFWTDHGEQFMEHGEQTHAYPLYSQENDGIAFFWSKNIVPGSWTGRTVHQDIAPTILQLLGLDMPPEVTGIPVGEAAADRPIFGFTRARAGTIQAVTVGDMKLHYFWSDEHVELYDRAIDPPELVDLYDSDNPDDPTVAELWTELEPRVQLMQDLVYGTE